MPFDFDPIYLIYLLVALAAGAVRRGHLPAVLHRARPTARTSTAGCSCCKDEPDRENMLVQLRRERGLTSSGDYRLPLVALNRLVLQSGLTLGIGKLAIYLVVLGAVFAFGLVMVIARQPARGVLAPRCSAARCCRCLVLRSCAGGGRSSSARSSPTRSTSSCAACAPAIRCRSRSPWWRARCPIRSAREFGIVADEITYGADLETALRNLYFRIGQDDLPLFVTAVAIQGSTGGNLGEILENLSAVIRQRFKMRRKIRALAAEGRASAMILSSLPIGMFLVIQFVAPDFYASVWHEDLTKIGAAGAGRWMGIGNFIMYRMVNFRI